MLTRRKKLNITPERRAKMDADRAAFDEQLRLHREREARFDYENLPLHSQADLEAARQSAFDAGLEEAAKVGDDHCFARGSYVAAAIRKKKIRVQVKAETAP